MKIIGWKVWYADSAVFDSRQGDWLEAPANDVQLVVVFFDDGFQFVRSGSDYYWFFNDVFGCSSEQHLNLLAPKDMPMNHFKKGSWVSNEAFAKIKSKAAQDKW